MVRHSCGHTIPEHSESQECGGQPGTDSQSGPAPDRDTGEPILVTDGGREPPEDEDTGEDPDADDEYIGADEIVDDDISDDDIGDESPAEQQPPDDEPSSRERPPADDQPSSGQQPPGDDHPADEQPSGQPPGQPDQQPPGEPGDQPPGGPDEQPPGGLEEQPPSEPGERPPGGSGEQPPAEQQPPGQPDQQPPGQPGQQPRGRQPAGQQPAGQPQGQPRGQQPAGQQPRGHPQGQQPPAGQQTSGQPTGGQQPPAGQPAGQQPPAGQPTRQPGTQTGGQQEFVDQLKEFPLLLGGILGSLAMLVPFAILSAVAFATNEQDVPVNSDGDVVLGGTETLGPPEIASEALFEFLQFGSGERVRNLFLVSSDTDINTVSPADYPTWETELETLLPLVRNSPELLMLILYILAPYILFIGSRFLARHYAPGQEPLDYVGAGATVAVGTVPIALVLALAFSATDMVGAVLVGGLVIPAVIGALGGLSIYGFDDYSALYSSLFGWSTILLGVVIAFLLSPFSSGSGTSPDLETAQQFVVGLGGYLSTVRLDIVDGSDGQLLAVAVVVTILGAGFLRTWLVKERVTDEIDGARAGASIFLGFVRPIMLLLGLFPLIVAFVEWPLFGSAFSVGLVGSVVSGSGDYLTAILIAGVVLPTLLGAAGGYLAIWYRDRNQPTQPQPRQRPR